MIYVYCEYLSYVSMNIEYLIELMDVFTPASYAALIIRKVNKSEQDMRHLSIY